MIPDNESEPAWWQTAAIYQICPTSFQDSTGNGMGDLTGIVHRLDYLAWLGIDAIWICPFFASPMCDFGYDIADHCAIDPLFGDMGDFDHLVESAHTRGIRVILDFVPNHTSDRHAWFEESRSSRASEKRDWYVWRDGDSDGGPPNNWISNFGGSAWQWDEATEQYYYHAFLPRQPDLNWRNAAVREAMSEVLRFWLERGVDGFRVDAINTLVEDALLRDNPADPDWRDGMNPSRRHMRWFNTDRPETHECVATMRRVLDEHSGRVLIGEINMPVD